MAGPKEMEHNVDGFIKLLWTKGQSRDDQRRRFCYDKYRFGPNAIEKYAYWAEGGKYDFTKIFDSEEELRAFEAELNGEEPVEVVAEAVQVEKVVEKKPRLRVLRSQTDLFTETGPTKNHPKFHVMVLADRLSEIADPKVETLVSLIRSVRAKYGPFELESDDSAVFRMNQQRFDRLLATAAQRSDISVISRDPLRVRVE